MTAKIGVFVKYVPDSNTKIELKDGHIDESNIKYVMNPYDEFAVEEAVKTKEAWVKAGKECEIVGIGLGPKAAAKALRDAFAVGVDRGVLIVDEERKANEPLSISKALAHAAKQENFEIIFAGKQAIDSDSHAVAQMVAQRLAMAHVGVVSKIEWKDQTSFTAERDVDGGVKEKFEARLPVLITANKGLNKMRLASLPNIRKASQKELKEVPLEGAESGVSIESWALPADRADVKMIEGETPQQVAELVRLLREEAKVI